MQQSPEQRADLGTPGPFCVAPVALQEGLYLTPYIQVYDFRVLASVDFLLVFNLARVNDIGKDLVKAGLSKRATSPYMPLARHPAFVQPLPALQFLDHRDQTLVVHIQG